MVKLIFVLVLVAAIVFGALLISESFRNLFTKKQEVKNIGKSSNVAVSYQDSERKIYYANINNQEGLVDSENYQFVSFLDGKDTVIGVLVGNTVYYDWYYSIVLTDGEAYSNHTIESAAMASMEVAEKQIQKELQTRKIKAALASAEKQNTNVIGERREWVED